MSFEKKLADGAKLYNVQNEQTDKNTTRRSTPTELGEKVLSYAHSNPDADLSRFALAVEAMANLGKPKTSQPQQIRNGLLGNEPDLMQMIAETNPPDLRNLMAQSNPPDLRALLGQAYGVGGIRS